MQPRAAFAGFVRSNGSESGVSDHRALCKGLFGHGGQEKSTAFGSLSPEGPSAYGAIRMRLALG